MSFQSPSIARADDLLSAREIINEAVLTVEHMKDHPDFKTVIKFYMQDAKAVVIFPSVIKAGLIFGGEGGSGVVLARADNGEWSYPAFVSLGSGSFGLQAGLQRSETMLIVRTGNGLTSILEDNVTIGGKIAGAIGPRGVGAEAATTTNLSADVLSYSIAQGVFVGASLDGAVIWTHEEFNTAFYDDRAVTPQAIVIDGLFANPEADKLRDTLRLFQE